MILAYKKQLKLGEGTSDLKSLFNLLEETRHDLLADEIGFDFGDEAIFEQYNETIKEHLQSGASLDMLSKIINCHPDRLTAYVHENINCLLNLEEDLDEDDTALDLIN